MEKLYVWFNPRSKQIYYKICRNCDTFVGHYNQYGHLLLTTLSIFDNKVYSNITYRKMYQIMAKKRYKRKRRLYNRFHNIKSERRVSIWKHQ